MIGQAEKRFDPKKVEKESREYWEAQGIYERAKKRVEKGERYYFLDGPPYASGAIHLGTAWNKILKDVVLRHLTMKGYNVRRQPGWDCHGLPIEVMVEKKHNLKNKQEIVELGVDRFIDECREWALRHVDIMTGQFRELGVWMDWDRPYMTLHDEYIEAAWWTIKKAHEKGLLINDFRVVTWCPRCETALAEAEIEYQDRSDTSIYVKFPLADREGEYLLIWTTTPWTLIGNLAVMVHPDFDYARVKTDEGVFIIAAELAHVLKEEFGLNYETLETLSGRELEGLRYTNPLSGHINVEPEGPAYQVILADFVTLEEGTGLVHCAPGHGPEDFEAAEPYGIKPICPVDEQGRFTEEGGKYTGLIAKKDDGRIIEDLQEMDVLLDSKKISHRYGHCWRCKSPIIYRSTKQWFIKITALKERMLEEIEKVEWIPEWAGSARFRDWIENSRDWTISRQRYWGIPLPVWICGGCGRMDVIGSRSELAERGGSVKELHKPYVDEVRLRCGCGGEMTRVPDVLDVWFDSGVAAWASLGYPSREDEFSWYPADLIAEGHDQTRGWFYSLLGCGLLAFDEIPYRKVLMHGFTLDEKGNKMSKSLGNVVTPEEVVERYGVDVLRFYVLWANKPWDDLKFSWEEIDVVKRAFNILWNVYVFSTTYMSIDAFDPSAFKDAGKHYKKEDLWILSRFNRLVKEVNAAFESLNLHAIPRALQDFILDDLSRWYIPLIRQRTWIEKDDPVKLAAYHTLWTVLRGLSILMAPVTPHLSEELHRNLVRPFGGAESVHLEDWIEPVEGLIDPALEEQMSVVRSFVEAVSSAREKRGIKRRWPVKRIVFVPEGDAGRAVKELEELAKAQANTPEIVVVSSAEAEDLQDPERYEGRDFDHGKVFIDLERTEDIIREGLSREIVRRIQQMRKEMDLDVEAFIEANIEVADPVYAGHIKAKEGYIAAETRAKGLYIKGAHKPFKRSWDISGKRFIISIGKCG
ncbi:MAG: isoleucine--tRNA ligase [Methanobacteriota archaeon]|nr:MAG: isoleucine--tRNA ligase [Euryarchaeota archaeon]